MPLLTAYVLALMPRRVSTPFGMSGNMLGFGRSSTTEKKLSAMTKVKISNWKRDMLAWPLGSLSTADRSILPIQIQTIIVSPSPPTNRQSTKPQTCPIRLMTILLRPFVNVVKRPTFSQYVNPAAPAHQVKQVIAGVRETSGSGSSDFAQVTG